MMTNMILHLINFFFSCIGLIVVLCSSSILSLESLWTNTMAKVCSFTHA